MLINDFLNQLQTLTGSLRPLPDRPTVHVVVNNASVNRRPSAALIEVAERPDLALLVANLQADYGGRTLVLGREIWPAGERSRSKRRLSEWVDAFLADLKVELDAPLPEPVSYVGRDRFGGERKTRARSWVAKAGSRSGMDGERETSVKSPFMGDSILIN